jgi:hypothetical protein
MPVGSPLSSIVLIVKVLVRPGRRVSVSPGGCDLIRSKVIRSSCGSVPTNGMSRSFGSERDCSHEENDAAPHRGSPTQAVQVELTIGIDLGDVWSHYCSLNEDGEVVDRGRFRTTPKAIEKWFIDLPPARVAMEAGVHSIWISEQLQQLGHGGPCGQRPVSCERSLTAIARATRWMQRSWHVMRGLIRTSFDRSRIAPLNNRKHLL